jgi:hypothetical protein
MITRHVRPPTWTYLGFWHPTARFHWRAIKDPSRLSSRVGHSVKLVITLRHHFELPTSLLKTSFKSKLPMRDLSITLEWLTWSLNQALHRWSLCVRYSWRFISLDGLSCSRVTKVVVDFKKFVLSSPLWGFDTENRTRSWWSFGVDYSWKRHVSLWAPQQRRRHPLWVSELQKEILCLCASNFDLLPVLIQVCSYLEFDLILVLIFRV